MTGYSTAKIIPFPAKGTYKPARCRNGEHAWGAITAPRFQLKLARIVRGRVCKLCGEWKVEG